MTTFGSADAPELALSLEFLDVALNAAPGYADLLRQLRYGDVPVLADGIDDFPRRFFPTFTPTFSPALVTLPTQHLPTTSPAGFGHRGQRHGGVTVRATLFLSSIKTICVCSTTPDPRQRNLTTVKHAEIIDYFFQYVIPIT